jgi:lipoprotein-releasing system permease protein
LEELDDKFVLIDIAHIKKLNDWTADETGGYEISINDFDKLDDILPQVNEDISPELNAQGINKVYPQIFGWLDLQDINGVIIITLMLLVAGINIIHERIKMIGTLQAMGAESVSIRRVFLYVSVFLIGWGLLLGNIFGIGLCLLQNHFHLAHLNEESYYISYVPVYLSAAHILLLNAGSLLVCVAMMILPTLIITRISPLKAIRYS